RVGGAGRTDHGGHGDDCKHGGNGRCDNTLVHVVPSSWWKCGGWPAGRRPVNRHATFTCGSSVWIVKRPSLSSPVTRAVLGGSRSCSSYSKGGASGPAPAGRRTVA